MVAAVERLKARSQTVDATIAGIDSLVRNARACIELGHLPDLGKLMDLNQMLLAGLFVSTEEIERACRVAREAGALGAKLTGAGGGGAVIALVSGNAGAVLSAWEGRGIEGFQARIAAAPQAAP
jgi:mevalonate kinase